MGSPVHWQMSKCDLFTQTYTVVYKQGASDVHIKQTKAVNGNKENFC